MVRGKRIDRSGERSEKERVIIRGRENEGMGKTDCSRWCEKGRESEVRSKDSIRWWEKEKGCN